MALSALIFLASWAVPIIWEGQLADWAILACEIGMWVTWGVIVIDYLARLWVAPKKLRFIATNLITLLSVIVPMLRPLRLLALLAALNRQASVRLRGRVTTYAVGGTLMLMLSGAVAVLDAERHVGNITNLGIALWWAMATITTVGYGDYHPVTWEGRIIAAGLMLSGIALLGAVTATLASWLTDLVASENQDRQQQILTEVKRLRAELAQLRTEYASMSTDSEANSVEQGGGGDD